jgi:hypothetical protein
MWCTGKVAAWFALAGVTWLRGCKRGTHNGFPVEAEREKGRGSGSRLGHATREEEEGGTHA